MADPVTIASFFGASDFPSFMGPWEDAGNLYTVLVDRDASQIAVYQSTDSGATWASVATAGIDTATFQYGASVRVVQDVEGRQLWCAVVGFATVSGFLIGGVLRLVPFDLDSLTFGSFSSGTHAPVLVEFSGGTTAPRWEIGRRSDASIVAYVSYENPAGVENIAKYLYDLAYSGGWDAGATFTPGLPSGADLNSLQSSIMSASGSELMHGFTWDSITGGDSEVRDFTTATYFGADTVLLATSFGGRAGNQPMVGHTLSWNNAGTWMLSIPYWHLDDLYIIDCTDADPPGSMSETNLGTLSGGFGAPLTSAVWFNGVRYLFGVTENVGGSRNIVYWSNDGGGWSGPVMLLADVWAFNISAAAVLGGVGIIYDDQSGGAATPKDRMMFLMFGGSTGAACRYRWL